MGGTSRFRSSLLRHPHLRGGTGSHGGPDPSVPEDSSATTGTRYYMNHCEHCDAKLGDFETIEEFDSPLAPLDPPTEDRLVIIPVSAPIESESRARPLPFASSVS